MGAVASSGWARGLPEIQKYFFYCFAVLGVCVRAWMYVFLCWCLCLLVCAVLCRVHYIQYSVRCDEWGHDDTIYDTALTLVSVGQTKKECSSAECHHPWCMSPRVTTPSSFSVFYFLGGEGVCGHGEISAREGANGG